MKENKIKKYFGWKQAQRARVDGVVAHGVCLRVIVLTSRPGFFPSGCLQGNVFSRRVLPTLSTSNVHETFTSDDLQFYLLVSHYTDTPIYIFPISLNSSDTINQKKIELTVMEKSSVVVMTTLEFSITNIYKTYHRLQTQSSLLIFTHIVT